MMHFILITTTVTSVEPSGLPSVTMKRDIRRLDLVSTSGDNLNEASMMDVQAFAQKYLASIPGGVEFTVTSPTTITCNYKAFNEQRAWHFTGFNGHELPFYAKYLKAEELQEFITYALDLGLDFRAART